MPETDDAIRSRLIRNSDGPLVIGERPDHIDEARPSRHFYRPGLPKGYTPAENDQLAVAHTSVDAIADDIRRTVDAIWRSEPNVGVSLTPAQKHAWRKSEVTKAVEAELGKRLGIIRPAVEKASRALTQRREKLTAKGSVKLDGVPAQRAMQLVETLARMEPEIRSLRVLEALNATDADSKELLRAIAWSNSNLGLVSPETRQRAQAVLVAQADPDEYAALTDYDVAVQATSESLDNLSRWASGLAEEMG